MDLAEAYAAIPWPIIGGQHEMIGQMGRFRIGRLDTTIRLLIRTEWNPRSTWYAAHLSEHLIQPSTKHKSRQCTIFMNLSTGPTLDEISEMKFTFFVMLSL
jgi:hypothetical protein